MLVFLAVVLFFRLNGCHWHCVCTGLQTRSRAAATCTLLMHSLCNLQFPLMIGVTATVVLLFVGFAFRSVLIPLRSLFSIALTLTFVSPARHDDSVTH